LLAKAIELHEGDKGSLHVLYAARAQHNTQRKNSGSSGGESSQGMMNGFASAGYSLFAGLSKYVDMNNIMPHNTTHNNNK